MNISILEEPKEILIQTVSLIKNKEVPENIYLFRCPYCSSSSGVQIQGNVYKIDAGLTPTDDVVTIHPCKGCKRLYTFQTIAYTTKKQIKVTLISQPGAIGLFYCWLCRNPMLQFKDDRIVSLPEFHLIKLPAQIPCVNANCQLLYDVVDII